MTTPTNPPQPSTTSDSTSTNPIKNEGLKPGGSLGDTSRVKELTEQLKESERERDAKTTRIFELEEAGMAKDARVAELEAKLRAATAALDTLQDKYNAKIASLKTEIEICNRRVQNAKYISEANEVLAAESLVQQLMAETRAGDMRVRMERTNTRMQNLVSSKATARIDKNVMDDKIAVNETEHEVRELYADPSLNLPHESAKRRLLSKLEARLQSLRSRYDSEVELRQRLGLVMDVYERLCTAAALGDVDEVRQLLSRGVSVNVVDQHGFNALYYACGGGHVEAVKALISQGADLIDEDGQDRPLVVAARAGHLEVVKLLLDKGAPVDQAEGHTGKTALHVATEQGHEEIVEHLLNCGASVDKHDGLGNAALHIAAQTPYVTIAVLLIDRGADTNARNSSYYTPMQIANERQNHSFVVIISRYLGQEVGVTNQPPYSLEYNPLDPNGTLTKLKKKPGPLNGTNNSTRNTDSRRQGKRRTSVHSRQSFRVVDAASTITATVSKCGSSVSHLPSVEGNSRGGEDDNITAKTSALTL